MHYIITTDYDMVSDIIYLNIFATEYKYRLQKIMQWSLWIIVKWEICALINYTDKFNNYFCREYEIIGL